MQFNLMIEELLTFGIGLLTIIVVINRYYLGKCLSLYNKALQKKKEIAAKLSRVTWFPDYPSVTVIIPCYNEGEGIYHTIMSLVHSDYPAEKLRILVVDDCSSDDSFTWASQAQRESAQVLVLRNEKNMGKRKGINKALRLADSPFIVSVDSDVIVDKYALKKLVSYFDSPEIAAVGGKVKILNTKENWLTKMQTVKYYLGYEFLKSLENGHQQVMCLSGCLTMYRREVLLELEPIVENRNILGISIKYGEDRFLTRQIVKAGYKTTLNLDAFCFTAAPSTLPGYMKQQLRWRRSNFVDFLGGVTHAHRLKPLVAFHYLANMSLQLLYPLVVAVHVLEGQFLYMLAIHFIVLFLLSLFYHFDRSYSTSAERVNPLWLLFMGPLMPMTYLFLSPLALFTLDTGSWETRQKKVKAS